MTPEDTVKIRRRLIALTLAAVLGYGSLSCMGQFAATKMLYNFNSTITDSKIINNLVFWALLIIPVYNLAIAADGIVLNTIEFWTGNNLLAEQRKDSDARVAQIKAQRRGDGQVMLSQGDRRFTLTPIDARRVLVTEGERVLGVAELGPDGAVVYDAQGRQLTTISRAQAEAEAPLLQALPLAL